MKYLYAPWRSSYTQHVDTKNNKEFPCIFCTIGSAEHTDTQEFVLYRSKHVFVILNKYPYNPGHILVIPYTHSKNLYDLNFEVQAECMRISSMCCAILEQQLGAHGINIGINTGKAAGASIVDHLHIHVLPRFFGDTNFLPTIAKTKQISLDLHDVYKKLKKGFQE